MIKPESKKMVLTVGGKTVEIETGKYAKQATSSVTVKCGGTMLFIHATVSKEPRVGIDFFPLLIDYEERMSAIGKIPGGYTRTEGRSSEKAILVSRLIDRPIRPLWPKGYRNDVQIVSQLFAYDQEEQPDILSIIGASTALMLSGAPFEGPVGAVRVGRIDGQFIANPTHSQDLKSDMNIVIVDKIDENNQNEILPTKVIVSGKTIPIEKLLESLEINSLDSEIVWKILDIKNSKALVISNYALECRRYNARYEDVSWEECTLRKWLNNDFINTAFNTEEQNIIKKSLVDNSASTTSTTTNEHACNNTNDKVYLLSYKDVTENYFTTGSERMAKVTDYAPTVYFDDNGNEIQLNEGKTYIAVAQKGRNVSFS